MSDAGLLLGIDAGTSRIKALLVDASGEQVWSNHIQTPWQQRGDKIEMEVEDLKAAVSQVLARAGQTLQRVEGVGIAGIAESGAPLDGAGHPLAPVIAWHDPRGRETVEHLHAIFGEALEQQIGQRIRTVSSVAKLGWLLSHGCSAPQRWLGVPELILWHLTGAQSTEHSLAARTGCFDITTRSYLPEVSVAAGIGSEVWLPVMAAGDAMGLVGIEGTAWSRLPRGAPVTIAGHDHLAGMEGVGARPDDLVNSVGTAESVLRLAADLPDIAAALEARVAISLRPGGSGWVALGGAARAGVVLAAAAELLDEDIEELDDLAARSQSVDAGELLRSIEAGAASDLPRASPGEVWRGLLEALAARTAEAAGRVTSIVEPGARMIVFGGGARSRPWMEIKARLVGVPLVTAGALEAAARGAAMFAGIAAGWWPSIDDAPSPILSDVEP